MTHPASEIDRGGLVTVLTRTAIVGPVVANIAFVMELTLVPLLLPSIHLQFGLSISELAWLFNSYGIAVALGVLLGGWCGDAFDTRKVFVYGVAFFAIGSFLVAAADGLEALIIGRTIQGLGGGIFSPLVPLLLTSASPLKPGRTLIVWGSMAGYVAALAPLFYGSLLSERSWNIGFILIAIVATIALVILNKLQITENLDASVSPKAKYYELFRSRNLWLTFIYVFCTYGSITYYLFRLPVWMSDHDVKTADVGLVLSVMWLTFSGLSTLLRNMVDRPHLRIIMLATPLLIVAGFVLSYSNENFPFLILSSVLVGSALACSNAPSTQLVLKFAPNGMSAVSTSLDITFARFGGITTVAVLADVEFAYATFAICLSSLVAAICAMTISEEFANNS